MHTFYSQSYMQNRRRNKSCKVLYYMYSTQSQYSAGLYTLPYRLCHPPVRR